MKTRPNRPSESLKKPDPAWGYTGHEMAHRYDVGDEHLSMASRIARRRGERSSSRTVVTQPCHFPPRGLDTAAVDLKPSTLTGPKNANVSSAKLCESPRASNAPGTSRPACHLPTGHVYPTGTPPSVTTAPPSRADPNSNGN